MTCPGNERVAVAQTPYSAFPGAPGTLERIAGAQTDVQYCVHQGFTRYGATFWVGANALLRKAALEDIATIHVERGHQVVKYIQDRTPIEDTESSIDLADRGWTLYNHPQRLAWSATPPDFGALLIQRRRWANGGLVILPKALRYLIRGPQAWRKSAEAMLRVHYLASIALVNIAFLYVMFGPVERNIQVVWIPISMLPFMVAYARDLVHCGYRWGDFLRVYALNFLLLPINLGGTLLSLRQAITGRKAPFGRTPKVTGRTAAPAKYVLAEYGLTVGGRGNDGRACDTRRIPRGGLQRGLCGGRESTRCCVSSACVRVRKTWGFGCARRDSMRSWRRRRSAMPTWRRLPRAPRGSGSSAFNRAAATLNRSAFPGRFTARHAQTACQQRTSSTTAPRSDRARRAISVVTRGAQASGLRTTEATRRAALRSR